MTDIFISYSSKDRAWVQGLASALEEQGYRVWWDTGLLSGDDFHKTIPEKLDAAACVIVVWTPNSVESIWVKAEANRGLRRNVLIPILAGDTEIPIPFDMIHSDNFREWSAGDVNADEFKRLLLAVSRYTEPSLLLEQAAHEAKLEAEQRRKEQKAEAKRKQAEDGEQQRRKEQQEAERLATEQSEAEEEQRRKEDAKRQRLEAEQTAAAEAKRKQEAAERERKEEESRKQAALDAQRKAEEKYRKEAEHAEQARKEKEAAEVARKVEQAFKEQEERAATAEQVLREAEKAAEAQRQTEQTTKHSESEFNNVVANDVQGSRTSTASKARMGTGAKVGGGVAVVGIAAAVWIYLGAKPSPEPAYLSEPVASSMTISEPYSEGERVYRGSCIACHASGLLDAPKLGDKKAWNDRIGRGKESLYVSASNGHGLLMPQKGGNPALTDDEIKAAVDWMIKQSR